MQHIFANSFVWPAILTVSDAIQWDISRVLQTQCVIIDSFVDHPGPVFLKPMDVFMQRLCRVRYFAP